MFRAHVQLRILTLLLDWKRRSSSQSSSFSSIRIVRSNISAGCGYSLQLVILFEAFFISFEISSKLSCLLSAVPQSILFTQMLICFFLNRFYQCRKLFASVLGFHCNLRDGRYAVLRVSGVVSISTVVRCQVPKEPVRSQRGRLCFRMKRRWSARWYASSSLTLFAEGFFDIGVFLMMSATVALFVFRVSIPSARMWGSWLSPSR